MATTQEWFRVNLPRSEKDGATHAYPQENGTVPKAICGQQQSSLRQHPRRRRRRRAPGPIACSRSSGEIIQRSANVSLSPVTGSGATSFSSVASAFDFHHHLGSDPASELLVLKHILTRECLLSRLEAVCGQLRKRFQLCPAAAFSDSTTTQLGEGGDGIVSLLSSMRDATVAVIEAIAVWRKDMKGHPPSAFVWDGDNYLLKITNDLNFLAGVQPLVDTLKMHPARFCRNPLMLPQTLDEQRRDGELYQGDVDAISSGGGKRRHLYRVAQVLLDEESLERKRETLQRGPSKSLGTLPICDKTSQDLSEQHGLSAGWARYGARPCAFASSMHQRGPQASDRDHASHSPNGCRGRAEEDRETRRRQHRLSRYEEARSQLVSLSTSPADEEYFLSSRRFWSKEELGDLSSGAVGSSSSPAHQPPSGYFRRGGHRSGINVSPASSGVGSMELGQRDRTGKLANGGGGGGERLPDHKQRGVLPPPRDSHTRRLRADGLPRQATGGDAHQRRGSGGDDDERGKADIWSRPDRFGGGSSAALSCLTVDDVEQILRDVDPSPATVAVCAAVVFLLAPEDQEPVDFLWPQGFEAIALPVEDFLWSLHQASGRTASSAKAGFLAPVLQREHLLPGAIEQQGGHAVASLCAWALEELQAWEEFAEWSQMALEPWYETQLIPAREDVPESDGISGCEVRLVYKALHTLPRVGSAYVMSLFEANSGGGGLIVRAFDRAKRNAFWLSLAKDKLDSFGTTETRSPATLAAALARRLSFKEDVVAGTKRLVLPPAKKAETISEKKKRPRAADKATSSVDSGVVGCVEIEAEVEAEREAEGPISAGEGVVATPRSPPLPSTEDSAMAEVERTGQARSHPRWSYPPPTRGSTVENLGPLLESQGDGSECSEGDAGHARSAPSAVGAGGGPEFEGVGVVTRSGADAHVGEVHVPLLANIKRTTSSDESTIESKKGSVAQTLKAGEAILEPTRPVPAPQAEAVLNLRSSESKEVEIEESNKYADDFAPGDQGEGNDLDLQGEVRGVGMEESSSYADDFAVDEDENNVDDNRQQEWQGGSEKEKCLATPLAGKDGDEAMWGGTKDVAPEAPVVSEDGPDLSSGVRFSSGVEDGNVSESVVTGLGSPSGELRMQQKIELAAAAAPQGEFYRKRSAREHQGMTSTFGGETADVEGKHAEDGGYENEFLSEDGEDDSSARAGAAQQSNQPGVAGIAKKGSAAAAAAAAGGEESLRHIREGNDEPGGPLLEAVSASRAPGEATVNKLSDPREAEQREAVQKVRPREVNEVLDEYENGQRPKAEADHRPVKDTFRSPIVKPIVVDMLGNVERGFMREVSTRKFDVSSQEDLQDKDLQDELEVSAASEIAAAMVQAATGSALKLMSERSEGYVAETEGDTVAYTNTSTAAEIIGEESDTSTVEAVALSVEADHPQIATTQPPQHDSEEMLEEYADDGDTPPFRGEIRSLSLGERPSENVRDKGGDSDDDAERQPPTRSPPAAASGTTPLREEDHCSEASSAGPVGEETDPSEAALRLTQGVSSTAEDVDFDEDFEEDFDDDFDDDLDADATGERRDEEENGARLDVAEADEELHGGERIPEDCDDRNVRCSPGDREEGERKGGWLARTQSVEEAITSAGVIEAMAAVAASSSTAVEPPDELGDDFEDDFEDP